MKFKQNPKYFRKYYKHCALILLLLFFAFIPFALSGCGSGGSSGAGGNSSSTGAMTAYPYGGIKLLKSDNTVTYTASLYELGNPAPLESNVRQNADGSFTFTYTASSAANPLYVVVTGTNSANGTAPVIFESFAGTINTPVTTIYIDELTTAETAEAAFASGINNTDGVIGGGTALTSADSAALTYFNSMVNAGTNPGTAPNAQINLNANAKAVNTLELIAGALAECGNEPDSCTSGTLNTGILGGNDTSGVSNTTGAVQFIINNPGNSALTASVANTAVNSGNIYGASSVSPSSLTLYVPPVPAAPVNLRENYTSTQASLSWTASIGATGYNVYYSTSSGGPWTLLNTSPVAGTAYTVTGLTNPASYSYVVTALNSAGEGSLSATAAAATVVIPPAPTNVAATASGSTQASLSWTASIGATGYNVYYSTSSGGPWTLLNTSLITGTTETVTNLTDGITYYFVVTAVNSSGTESGYSNQVTVTPATPVVTVTTNTFVAGSYPADIAIDASGNVWVANQGNQTVGTGQFDSNVTELSPSGTVLGTYVAGNYPTGIAIDASGNVLIAGYYVNGITELSPSGAVLGTATNLQGYGYYGMAIDPSGNVWIASNVQSTVTELNPSGAVLGTFTVDGYASGYPQGIAIDASGNVWVADGGNGTAGTAAGDSNITELNSTGWLLGTYTAGSYPTGIAIDASGNVWVANWGDGTVTELNSSGGSVGTFTVGSHPTGIAIDASGNVWVTNENAAGAVTELSPSGAVLGTFNVGDDPQGIAIDASGNVWVANNGNGTPSANQGQSNITELVGAAKGPQFWPYNGIQFPGGGNY